MTYLFIDQEDSRYGFKSNARLEEVNTVIGSRTKSIIYMKLTFNQKLIPRIG